ncbi:hypothetical protein KIN20_028308 [Parelaphostrongylus tenuis]|uniref:Uncharacterized protein n=1 Tax=Parelaphostrongylus tenuis TaxID=148309 RepID=A0AAD5R0L2_PARTN|nr:hypothetical protein KIN20_028308 [Parelaphostrongylus tenuis]
MCSNVAPRKEKNRSSLRQTSTLSECFTYLPTNDLFLYFSASAKQMGSVLRDPIHSGIVSRVGWTYRCTVPLSSHLSRYQMAIRREVVIGIFRT